jgi:hypothetical protein
MKRVAEASSIQSVVVYAPPFGLGPLARGVDIAATLGDRADVTFATWGSEAIDYAIGSLPSNVKVVDCCTRNASAWPARILDASSLLFVVMDPRVARQVRDLRPSQRIVFYDSLLWWRVPGTRELDAVDVYIAQDFPGVRENLDKVRHMVSRVFLTSPYVPSQVQRAAQRDRRQLVVVNLGGLTSPPVGPGCYRRYLEHLASELRTVAEDLALPTVICAGGQVTTLLKEIGIPAAMIKLTSGLSCATYPRVEFLRLLSGATIVFTVPGIETVYESRSFGVPVRMIPPTNSAQLLPAMVMWHSGIPCLWAESCWSVINDLARPELDSKDATIGIVESLETEHHRWLDGLAARASDTIQRSQHGTTVHDGPEDLHPTGYSIARCGQSLETVAIQVAESFWRAIAGT